MQPSTSSVPLFQSTNLDISFGSNTLFSGLDFSLYPEKHTAIVGKNGCGKSTLLKLISADMRLPHKPGKPSIFWGFQGILDPSALNPKMYARLVSPEQQTVYVRQGWKVTGEEIVLSGFANTPLLYDLPSEKELHIAQELAEKANLKPLLDLEAAEMSQGQLRAVLLMRALVGKPALLLLDEPFDGLDNLARNSIITLLQLAANAGTTLTLTAHRQEDIPPFITRIYAVSNNKLSLLPAKDSVKSLQQPITPAAGKPQDSHETEFLALLKKQKKRSCTFSPEGDDVFSLKDVDVYIDRKKVLHKLQWTVQKGEHWIVSGCNGSGKSTLLRLLYGEEFAAFGGELRWFGKKRMTLSELHLLVGYVSDKLHYCYEYELTAEEVVLSGISGTIGLYSESSEEDRFITLQWMKKLDLLSFATLPYHTLSTGQARRILLARSLVGAPSVLLLDEPFSGLDPKNRQLFLDLLPLLAASGVQLIMVSHHHSDFHNVFTHMLELEQGHATYAGPRPT